jgi:hypothetical protein
LLRDLWDDKRLDSTSRITCFRKHNFTAILQVALDEIGRFPLEERAESISEIDQALERILRSDSDIKIRPQPEQAASLFGSALTILNELSTTDRELVGSAFADKSARIFRTILYDDRATKKVFHIFQI